MITGDPDNRTGEDPHTSTDELLRSRYGSPTRRSRTWLPRALGVAAVLLAGAAAYVGYQNLGSPPIEGKHVAFANRGDRAMGVTLEVRREDPQRPASCVVRAREKSGAEIARREVFIPPSAPDSNTVRVDTQLYTGTPAVTGEVYGCSYHVPGYLQPQQH